MAMMLVMLAGGIAQAQNTNRKLKVGDTVTGNFDAKTFAQVYTFDATVNDTITITATSRTRGLQLAVLLNNGAGQTLTQVAELSKTEVVIRDFKPPADGPYFITVLRATGVQGNSPGQFTLALTGTAAAPSATNVELTDGLSVALAWSSTDDMNIEVRDPVGGSVNRNNPTIASGGRLSANVNDGCTNATADNPTETVNWPKGAVPAGSYEIIVYYTKACPQGATPPVSFSVTVTVDGKTQDPIRGTISAEGQAYVASFVLSAPDQLEVRPGGENLAVDLTQIASKATTPGTLNSRNQANGTINHNNPVDVYAFDAKQGEVVTVTMRAVDGGSLDPYLLLLGPTPKLDVVASNDDENSSTRDSLINKTLPADGRYVIAATRFAQAIGGTEGNYVVTLTRGRVTIPNGATTVPSTTGTAEPTPVATASVGGTTGLPAGSIEAALRWNSRADMRIIIRDPQGRLVYTDNPRIDSGGILQQSANLNCKNTTGTNPQDYIYWNTQRPPAGTYEIKVFQNSTCDDITEVNFTLNVSVAGKEVINVSNTGRPDKQVFLITFTVDNNGEATAGQGDYVSNQFTTDISGAIGSAPTLTYNQSPATGRIDLNTKYVIYQFKAIAGDKIRITLQRSSANGGNLDAFLYLLQLGSDGKTTTQLASNDDAGDTTLGRTDSRINYTITADGTYIIVATHYGVELGGTIGNYELRLAGPTR